MASFWSQSTFGQYTYIVKMLNVIDFDMLQYVVYFDKRIEKKMTRGAAERGSQSE